MVMEDPQWKCAKAWLDMGIMLGQVTYALQDLKREEGLPAYRSDFLISPDTLLSDLADVAEYVLEDCYHPLDWYDSEALPRRFIKEVNSLWSNWWNQPPEATQTQVDNLHVMTEDWVIASVGFRPMARHTVGAS